MFILHSFSMIHTIYTIYTIIPSLDKHPTKEVVIAVKKRSNENGILEKVSQSCSIWLREEKSNKICYCSLRLKTSALSEILEWSAKLI